MIAAMSSEASTISWYHLRTAQQHTKASAEQLQAGCVAIGQCTAFIIIQRCACISQPLQLLNKKSKATIAATGICILLQLPDTCMLTAQSC
jgi:hypothetical protein